MKIICIGAGAIGLLAGGSAAAQGADVTFLVKPGQENKLAGREILIQNQAQVWREGFQRDQLINGYRFQREI